MTPADINLPPLPPGGWAVGVSGGADSVALLSLLRACPGVRLHVVHLDHQTRGDDSAADAAFVRELAARWGLPCTVGTRGELETRTADLPVNPSARFRALRLALFREVVAARGLGGVILAHHADDQAETVLARLLRGAGYAGLAGMEGRAVLGGLVVLRPLLGVRRAALRGHMEQVGQPWREDASNASDQYQRNRLRRVLSDRPEWVGALLELADACRALREWVRRAVPEWGERFAVGDAAASPPILARESARRWLAARGVPAAALAQSPGTIDRLVNMAIDAASPARQHFAGELLVRRRGGWIGVDCRPTPTVPRMTRFPRSDSDEIPSP